MKHTFITFLFALLMVNGYSQNEKVIFKFSPLALIDEVTFPTIQGGIELRLKNRISWYNEIGIKYRTGYYEGTDTSFINSYGVKLKSEVRYYLAKNFVDENNAGRLSGLYLGGNIFFNRDYHNSEIGYYFGKDNSAFVIDNFAVKKNIIGTNFIFGLQEPIRGNFLVDVYAGVGFRIRFIDNLNREYDSERDTLDEPIDVTIQGIRNSIDLMNGISGTVNFTWGFRLCYKL